MHIWDPSLRDKNYKGSSYNLLVEWETGELTEEPLNQVITDDQVMVAQYARKNNLTDMGGWKRLRRLSRRDRKLTRMVNQVKLRSLRTSPKYQCRCEVPQDYAHAVRLDQQNGNTKWQDAPRLELKQLEEYSVFIDYGIFHIIKVPPGYQLIKERLFFVVKHDGRHKARMVTDGHLTKVPLNSVYANVVSLQGLQLWLFLGELNNMEAYATDI